MEHYPDIQRQQGTLFFIPHGDRAAIAISIERLIDLLDAMSDDPDIEDGGDLEPAHGWPNAGQPANEAMCLDGDREQDNADCEPALGALERHPNGLIWNDNSSQEKWHVGADDDREDDGDDLEPSLLSAEYRNGRIEVDLEGDDQADDEPSHGWTEHLDQTKAAKIDATVFEIGEGEPELGWCGHGCGVQKGEVHRDTEANGDELDLNGDEGDYSPADDCLGFGTIGRDMVRGLPIAAKRADAYAMLGGRSAC
ncbi:hypothetical protein [Shinella zoogloeoides]|uniref:hypothetical protein n=1 Tax=Shinella zoogloeoides TaxID=352475 RepID=UPI001F589958|nr:hypothetical protein [Shinella zoogloeoides]